MMAGTDDRTKNRINDYSRFFSSSVRRRRPFDITNIHSKIDITPPDKRILMAFGVPNELQYPFVSASLKTRDGTDIDISPTEIKRFLEYGPHRGMSELLSWLHDLVRILHAPPTMNPPRLPSSLDVTLNSGSRQAITQCIGLFLDEGDSLICEEFLYQVIPYMLAERNVKGVSIQSDKEGMDIGQLNKVLTAWDETKQGRRPKVIYIIPTCDNPMGRTWTYQRKTQLYETARQFDMLILEDDAYYHLYYQRPLPRSILSMDEDGRVIRLDTFSKIIAPGLRLGSVFGPKAVIEQLIYSSSMDSGGPSSISQMVVSKLVSHWGIDGYLRHGEMMSDFYKRRADKLLYFINLHLKGMVELTPPDGGMFMWVKLTRGDPSELTLRLMERGVFLLEGSMFTPDMVPAPYLRLGFSQVSDSQMEKGIKLIAEILRGQ